MKNQNENLNRMKNHQSEEYFNKIITPILLRYHEYDCNDVKSIIKENLNSFSLQVIKNGLGDHLEGLLEENRIKLNPPRDNVFNTFVMERIVAGKLSKYLLFKLRYSQSFDLSLDFDALNKRSDFKSIALWDLHEPLTNPFFVEDTFLFKGNLQKITYEKVFRNKNQHYMFLKDRWLKEVIVLFNEDLDHDTYVRLQKSVMKDIYFLGSIRENYSLENHFIEISDPKSFTD
jgi:hypothetical protein